MILRQPREKETVSWCYVILWSLIIFVTIPFARTIQKFVAQEFGREAFAYVVLATIVSVCALSVIYLYKHRGIVLGSYVWLIIVLVVFIGYTKL